MSYRSYYGLISCIHGPTLLAAIKEPSPMDILLTAMTKFYCNLNPCLVDALNIEKVSTLKDVQLSYVANYMHFINLEIVKKRQM